MVLEEAASMIAREIILAKRVGCLTSATRYDLELAARVVLADDTGRVATHVTRAALGVLPPLGHGPH